MFCDQEPNHICKDVFNRLKYDNVCLRPVDLSDQYLYELPKVVRITDGYCDYFDYTFSGQDVYMVTHSLAGERVVLKDHNEQQLSFPADHHLHFFTEVNGQKSNPSKRLTELLNGLDSESEVLLIPDIKPRQKVEFFMTSDRTVELQLETLTFIEAYDARYLVANSIVHEKLYDQPFIIPFWLPIKMEVAVGIKDGTEQEFKQLMKDLQVHVQTLKNDSTPGDQEIMLFNKDSDDEDPYDLLEPRNSQYSFLPPMKNVIDNRPPPLPISNRPKLPPPKTMNPQANSLEVLSEGGRLSQANYYVKPEPIPRLPAHTKPISDEEGEYDDNYEVYQCEKKPPVPVPTSTDYSHLPPPPVPTKRFLSGDHDNTHVKSAVNMYEKRSSVKGASATAAEKDAEYVSLKDIPVDIKSMSVKKVAGCLRHLNMEAHKQNFMDNDVDGKLLSTLSREELLDLGLNAFQARKMLQFIDGWRPKKE